MFSAASVCHCQYVCLFVRTIPSEQLNVGWSNLAVMCIVQKSRPSSNVKFKGQGHQGQKTGKLLSHPVDNARQGVRRRTYAASGNRRYHCVAAGEWRATPVGKSAHAVYLSLKQWPAAAILHCSSLCQTQRQLRKLANSSNNYTDGLSEAALWDTAS